jgi:hypothetical protein
LEGRKVKTQHSCHHVYHYFWGFHVLHVCGSWETRLSSYKDCGSSHVNNPRKTGVVYMLVRLMRIHYQLQPSTRGRRISPGLCTRDATHHIYRYVNSVRTAGHHDRSVLAEYQWTCRVRVGVVSIKRQFASRWLHTRDRCLQSG